MSRGVRVLARVTPQNLAKRYQRAVRRANKKTARLINRLATRKRKEAVNDIHQAVTLKKSYISARVRVIDATANNLEARIVAKGRTGPTGNRRGTLTIHFRHRQLMKRGKRAGISLQIVRGGPTLRLRHAFKFRLRDGDELGDRLGIAIRRAGSKERGWKGEDAPIATHGPSIAGMLNTRRDMVAGPQVREELTITLRRELIGEFEDGGLAIQDTLFG